MNLSRTRHDDYGETSLKLELHLVKNFQPWKQKILVDSAYGI